MTQMQSHEAPTTTTLTDLYRDRSAAIADLLASTTAWDRPTPCEGWTVRDLVDHLITTQRDFLAERDLHVPSVSLQDPARAWTQHTGGVQDLLADPAIGAREYDGHFGRTTVAATMATFYGWDLLVHRWDLARALGANEEFTDQELDQIEVEVEGFGEALYSPGICAAPLAVSESEPRQVRVLARLGRDARRTRTQ